MRQLEHIFQRINTNDRSFSYSFINIHKYRTDWEWTDLSFRHILKYIWTLGQSILSQFDIFKILSFPHTNLNETIGAYFPTYIVTNDSSFNYS